jgi:VanZ family protein
MAEDFWGGTMSVPGIGRSTRWTLLASCWLLLFIGTSIPLTRGTRPPEGADKLLHGLAFSLLAWLLCWAREPKSTGRTARIALVSLLAVGTYGVFDELHQLLIPTRTMELADLVADVVGAAAGAGLWAGLRFLSHRAAAGVAGASE